MPAKAWSLSCRCFLPYIDYDYKLPESSEVAKRVGLYLTFARIATKANG